MDFTAIEFINLGLGLFLVLMGYLVSNNPEFIAGYNTMDKSSRMRFDIDGYKKLMKISMIITGVIVIALTLILSFYSTIIGKLLVSIVPVSILPFFLSIKSKQYYYKEFISSEFKTTKQHLIILGLFYLLTFGGMGLFLFFASKEPRVFVENDKLIISGLYGVDVPIEDIHSVKLVDTIPKIVLRTNGLGLGCVRKGYFKFENNERPLLFLQRCDRPYIQIVLKDNKTIIINFKSKIKLKDIYQNLKKNNISEKS